MKEEQVLFNLLLKRPLFELGSKLPCFYEYTDLNGFIIPENAIEEFKHLTIFEQSFRKGGIFQ